MAKKGIPSEIKEEVQQIVERYNKEHKTHYQVSFRGKYCYLSRIDDRGEEMKVFRKVAKMMGLPKGLINPDPLTETKIGRLEWTGNMAKWDFAVFKYSREAYDPEEWMFPGAGELDGTIEGALRAGYLI